MKPNPWISVHLGGDHDDSFAERSVVLSDVTYVLCKTVNVQKLLSDGCS